MIDDKKMKEYEERVRQAELDESTMRTNQMQQQYMLQTNDDKSMIEQQLNLDDEIEKIDLLLRGWVLTRQPNGDTGWMESKDPGMKVLSEYGVQLILDTIAWYLNKNTLLSNYDETTINGKMEDFASDLNDDIFMSYEKVFMYPTLEECKKELKERIKHKVDLRKFAEELVGKNTDETEIERQILLEMEDTIERELDIIKAQRMKDKLKKFAMIMRKIQDSVHSTYLRAWKGQERTTLRTHMHISESKGNAPMQQEKSSPLEFFRRR